MIKLMLCNIQRWDRYLVDVLVGGMLKNKVLRRDLIELMTGFDT